MEQTNIYKDISERTSGNIYIGVVGPVRTGKSTFIKKFMDTLVVPNIGDPARRERATDELPQSAAGRTIMTTEPKFIPEEAVPISLDGVAELSVRMVDCVGYIVPSALGYVEGSEPRMVKTPWFEDEIPFNMAAEIGTKKVISEHSTIGLVVTTDGSISDIPREEYEEAEERVINELKEINKPFVILLNCMYPGSNHAIELSLKLSAKYSVPVMPVNCLELDDTDIRTILSKILYEFPVQEVDFEFPHWISGLSGDHWLKKELFSLIKDESTELKHIRDIETLSGILCECEHIISAKVTGIELGSGKGTLEIHTAPDLFYRIITETTGLEIKSEPELLAKLTELSDTEKKYNRVKFALEQVEATGYGIVMPSAEELTLKEPEIMRQGGQYGVKLRAEAPSIHMMRANIKTEIAPVVGSEKQSEDLIKYLLEEFEDDPIKIWDSNIFGKSLQDLVNEGLSTKLAHMPSEARQKLAETLERVINEGCSGLICIIL